VYTVESNQFYLHDRNRDIMPCCTLGKKQVAGIKFENGHDFGKVIESVDRDGSQRTSMELLTNVWIKENTDEAFWDLLKPRKLRLHLASINMPLRLILPCLRQVKSRNHKICTGHIPSPILSPVTVYPILQDTILVQSINTISNIVVKNSCTYHTPISISMW
jgi:hypothetical protein